MFKKALKQEEKEKTLKRENSLKIPRVILTSWNLR
jgi:hypothetical protein